jgi:hypothetical protein
MNDEVVRSQALYFFLYHFCEKIAERGKEIEDPSHRRLQGLLATQDEFDHALRQARRILNALAADHPETFDPHPGKVWSD